MPRNVARMLGRPILEPPAALSRLVPSSRANPFLGVADAMHEVGGYTIQSGAIEALGPVHARGEGGALVYAFTVHTRGGHALLPSFETRGEAESERNRLLRMIAPPRQDK
jgi:hypothetical protein